MAVYRQLHWLTMLPVMVAVFYFHRDVPYHDQWDLLPLIDAYYQGRLSAGHFLAPHNGHILLLPRAVMLALAIATHWNTFAEVCFSLMLGAINFGLLLGLARHVYGDSFTCWHKTALGLIVFSLAQADNWLWGWQLQVPLCLAGVLAGLLALRAMATPWLALLVAVLCGFAASFSFAAGLVFWFAAVPLVWERQRAGLLPWFTAAAVCIGLYLHWLGDTAPVAHLDNDPGMAFYRDAIVGIFANTVACLGSLAARFHNGAALLAGLLAMGWLAALLRTTPAPQRALLVALALFGIGAALLIALSRSGMGPEQMLTSRYTTLSVPFWASLLFAIRTQPQHIPLARTVGITFMAAIVCTSLFSVKDFQRLHNRLERGANALLLQSSADDNQKALAIINPREDRAQAEAEFALLQHYRLSVYRR